MNASGSGPSGGLRLASETPQAWRRALVAAWCHGRRALAARWGHGRRALAARWGQDARILS